MKTHKLILFRRMTRPDPPDTLWIFFFWLGEEEKDEMNVKKTRRAALPTLNLFLESERKKSRITKCCGRKYKSWTHTLIHRALFNKNIHKSVTYFRYGKIRNKISLGSACLTHDLFWRLVRWDTAMGLLVYPSMSCAAKRFHWLKLKDCVLHERFLIELFNHMAQFVLDFFLLVSEIVQIAAWIMIA